MRWWSGIQLGPCDRLVIGRREEGARLPPGPRGRLVWSEVWWPISVGPTTSAAYGVVTASLVDHLLYYVYTKWR